MSKQVMVIGHKNPDTDSICSAIGYANLKNKLNKSNDVSYIPCKADDINPETAFVLDTFDVEIPQTLSDARIQLSDIEYRKATSISLDTPIFEAFDYMTSNKVHLLNVIDANDNLQGIISLGDIAKTFMQKHSNEILKKMNTTYQNIQKVLQGEIVVPFEDNKKVEGKVFIGTGTSDIVAQMVSNGDILILANDEEVQKVAIENGVELLILTLGKRPTASVVELAKKKGTSIIICKEHSFVIARKINQALAVSNFMIKDGIVSFDETSFIDDIKSEIEDLRYREFPIVGDNGSIKGNFRKEDFVNSNKKNLILVDHNEAEQAVFGLHQADVLEILDHHKIGDVKTDAPIYYQNMAVGCTATIVHSLYKKFNVEIDKKIAGLLASAILSDTLIFKSPTCTQMDIDACNELANIAGIECESYAMDMFAAGSDFASKTEKEIFELDYKTFEVNGTIYGVGQVSAVNKETLDELKPALLSYMKKYVSNAKEDMVYLMLTDIMAESSDLLCAGTNAMSLAEKAYGTRGADDCIYLQGAVSRKKQIIPQMTKILQN